MSSFKSNENIHKKEDGSYYVVSANNPRFCTYCFFTLYCIKCIDFSFILKHYGMSYIKEPEVLEQAIGGTLALT